MKITSICFLSVVAFASLTSLIGAAPPALKSGDKIVFLGDSITAGGARRPDGYIRVLEEGIKKRHPDLAIEFVGAGISGNKVPDLQGRVERDVVAKKPSIVFIYIGINDVWHGQKDPSKGTTPERFEAGLKEVIGKIKDAGARVIVCTPTVIGEKKAGANALDAKLDQYADISRGVAKELGLELCDLRKAFVDHLADHNPDDKASGVLTTDQVHLNPAGNRLVAETMLKMLVP
jgi:lysophospholipase L1-like esterase